MPPSIGIQGGGQHPGGGGGGGGGAPAPKIIDTVNKNEIVKINFFIEKCINKIFPQV